MSVLGRYACLAAFLVGGCSFTPGSFTIDAPGPAVTVGFTTDSTPADENVGTVMVGIALSEEPTQPVTVGYRVASSSTATAATDYTLTAGTLELATSAPQFVEVTILPDGQAESDETIVLELHSVSGATLGVERHTITISANTLPRVNFAQATSMANEAMTTVMVGVALDAMPVVPVTATYTVSGTATDGSDYTIAQGPLTFAVGETSAQIAVMVMQDTLPELSETITVALDTATAAVVGTTQPSHQLTIIDEDPDPSVSFTTSSASQAEGVAAVTLTVQLAGPSGKTVTVPFTAGGTATAPADYAYASTTALTFAPSVVTQTITINVATDTTDEDNETVITTLGTPTNATLGGTPQHTLTIQDNDDACFGPASGSNRVCLTRGPTQAVTLPGTLNTDNSSLCETAQPTGWTAGGQQAACFIKGTTINVTSTTVTGGRPLVLVASTSITIGTLLDASSDRVAGTTGPGAPFGSCTFGSNPQNSAGTDSGGGGGAGGTFRTQGGSGGDGSAGARNGGTPSAAAGAPTVLRAGCNGQRGGSGETGTTASDPGRGGGAVYLVSAGSITLNANAIINASGSGGLGSPSDRLGGSGGGSGGMIRLHAGSITAPNTAKIVANGGGGSAGSSGGTTGGAGGDPDPANLTVQASGGTGPNNNGNGGAGFAGNSPAGSGSNGDSNDGGGGGGGGGGFIHSNITIGSALTSAGAILIQP